MCKVVWDLFYFFYFKYISFEFFSYCISTVNSSIKLGCVVRRSMVINALGCMCVYARACMYVCVCESECVCLHVSAHVFP